MKKTRTAWTDDMEGTLQRLYPVATWANLQAALPMVTRTAIYQRALKLGLSRWNQGNAPLGTILSGNATDADIGWLAGILDGEGTIQLSRHIRKGMGTTYLTPNLTVVNTSDVMLRKVHLLMGGHYGAARDTLWSVRLAGVERTSRFLTILLPHLTCKAPRAELLIRYAEIRQAQPGRAAYGEQEEALYRDFYEGSGRNGASRSYRTYANPEPTGHDPGV